MRVVGDGRTSRGSRRGRWRCGRWSQGREWREKRRGDQRLRGDALFADGRDGDHSLAARAVEGLAGGGTAREEGFPAVGAFEEDIADGDGDVVGAFGAGQGGADIVLVGAEMRPAMLADEKDVEHAAIPGGLPFRMSMVGFRAVGKGFPHYVKKRWSIFT